MGHGLLRLMLVAGTEEIPDKTEALEAMSEAQEELREVAENPGIIRTWLEGLVPDILTFAFQVLIALIVYAIGSRLIALVTRMIRRSLARSGTDEGVRQFVVPLVKYSLYIVLGFFILGLFGIATTSAVAVLGSAGVAIGLALQGSLSNFAGGILILILKPFRVGDYIVEDTHGNEGTVSEISIFYTKLKTADNRVIVIPNGMLSNCSLINVTDTDKRRIDVPVGIAYEADIREAREALERVAEEEPARLTGEECVVFVDALGASAVEMVVRIWVAPGDYWQAKWRLTERVKYALDEAGIPIPYQQVDVRIRQPETPPDGAGEPD